MSTIDDWIAEVSQSSYGWPESLLFTYEKTRELLELGVPGDLVECGVGNGVHPAAMARACIEAGQVRKVRLFDSFVGMPNGGPNDHGWNVSWGDGSGRLEPTGVSACSLEDVAANLARWGVAPGHGGGWSSRGVTEIVVGDFHLYEGWFQRTLPYVAPTLSPVAFLRLDGDLYESTKVCLKHLYPLVSPGGIVVVDDFDLDGCRAAVIEYFNGLGSQVELRELEHITESGDVWWRKP